MTGNKLAAAIAKSKGKVFVNAAVGDDTILVYVQKSDLIREMRRYADEETGSFLEKSTIGWILNRDRGDA